MNLSAYIQGKRKGKEAHHIEREAMVDPFLADALDGFDAVGGDHAARIAGMRARLSASGRKSNRKLVFIRIAASLLLCISISGYFLLNKDERPLIAQSEISVNEKNRSDELEPGEQIQHHLETERGDAVVENSSPPPIIQDEFIVIADEVVAKAEMEIQLPDIAVTEISQDDKDSSMIARTEAKQPGGLTTPSGTRQQTMTAATSAKPEPKIGMKAYKKYLRDSMIRPETGECVKKKGEVIVEFKIDTEGRPRNIELRKKLCEDLDKETIRLIENGPVWGGDTSKSVILEVKF